MAKFAQGRFAMKYPDKYVGGKTPLYRSSWELHFLKWCDRNDAVLKYASEEFSIPYVSPVDGKRHKYYPDFYVKIKGKKYMVEVKPFKQTKEPKTQKKITKRYISEVLTWAVNKAKWNAAEEVCQDNGYKFMIITEKELGV